MMNMFGRDIMPRGLNEFASADSTSAASAAAAATNTVATTTSASTTPPPLISGLYAETSGCFGGDASTGRWPRQETLTLLEIRSRLDPKFKEANHKGPLWDEVSGIMSEEHGYQRSGKKCREKFENLYKYYKKTKEGKAGRQDGKHYRFFRQLEALYGENNNPASVPETNFGSSIHFQTQTNQEMFHSHHKNCDSLSLTNSTEFSTSSSDDNDHHSSGGLMENEYSTEKRRKKKRGRRWKVKIRDFIDSQMKKLIEKQEEWLDKLMKTIEQKEKERLLREEEWRKQEATRLEREHKFWAKEMAWIEARDAALMEALQKLTGGEIIKTQVIHEGLMGSHEIQNHSENQNDGYGSEEILNGTAHVRGAESSWPESETTRNTAKEGNKKRKENSRSFFYLENINDQSSSLYNQESTYCDVNDQKQETRGLQRNGGCGSSPSNSNIGDVNVPSESACCPFLMSEGGNLWDNYGLKLNNANQSHH